MQNVHVGQPGPQCDFGCIPMCDSAPNDMSLRICLWMFLAVIGQQNVNGVVLES